MGVTATAEVSRRLILAGGLLLALPARAATPQARRLAFAVFRNGVQIGEQQMSFGGDAASPLVTTEVRMAVKIGPITAYRYRHHATERWAGGRFASLETATDANGRAQKVSARRTDGGVIIESGKDRVTAPADAAPLSHWNLEAFGRPMFNPQEGKILKITAERQAPRHWAVRGEAMIDDWYDEAGVWSALKGRLKDGSTMEYRRI